MLDSFFRSIRRKLWTAGLCVLVVVLFRKAYPEFGQRVGCWLTGLQNTGVAQAFSRLLAQIQNGEGLPAVVEVFREGIF